MVLIETDQIAGRDISHITTNMKVETDTTTETRIKGDPMEKDTTTALEEDRDKDNSQDNGRRSYQPSSRERGYSSSRDRGDQNRHHSYYSNHNSRGDIIMERALKSQIFILFKKNKSALYFSQLCMFN